MATGIRFDFNPKATEKLLADQKMRSALKQVAADGATEAARLAPRSTGKLADSITSSTKRDGGQWVALVYFTQWYGTFWEFGHKGRSKPFLRPGVQSALSKVNGRFSSE